MQKGFIGLLLCLCSFLSAEASSNPFHIDFPVKKELTHEDYIEVQRLLRQIDLTPVMQENYVNDPYYTTYEDLEQRISRGIRQVLIDPVKGFFPITRLAKIGKGSDMCFVCCVPFSAKYVPLLLSIPRTLDELGFNGYFYYRIGGYPNPTGEEIQYAGVPYAFKIFLMREAKNLGFNKVMWLDASMLPLRDPTPLFHHLEKHGSFILQFDNPHYNSIYIFPRTREELKQISSIDVVTKRHLTTQVFGLDMNAPHVEKFIESYYKYVALGTPFISCFPEENVFSAIMEQSPENWPGIEHFSILRYQSTTDPWELDWCKKNGTFFYLRIHR